MLKHEPVKKHWISLKIRAKKKKIKHVNECDGTSVNGKYVARAESIKWITIQKEN